MNKKDKREVIYQLWEAKAMGVISEKEWLIMMQQLGGSNGECSK